MLRSLAIRDILIIDRLDLDLQPGLNVLTGETGAGKSILLDALGFVLGWRGRADLVRPGAEKGEVTAVFDLPPDHPARAVLAAADLPVGDELILRRTNSAEGRKSAWVNDRRCSGEVLRQLSDCLVELHGQQDDRGLLDPRGHLALLDAFAAEDGLRAKVATAWVAVAAARGVLAAAEVALDEARREEEFLRHAVAELDDLAPEPGEEPVLDRRRREMQGAERVLGDINGAARALGADGAEQALVDAVRWLEGAAEVLGDRLDAPLAALERAMAELSEAQSGVDACAEALNFDPRDLDTVEERLFAIRGLARKHGVQPDALPELATVLTARLEGLDAGERRLGDLTRALSDAERTYDEAAAALSTARQQAARRLDRAMAVELPPLKLDRAVFTTQITPADPGRLGRDRVAFTVATNPGTPAGPLDRIASGGELSRFLLALKVCLTGGEGVTLIFDEIDRGVGGATADAVGRRLAGLAAAPGAQVLVVTHSPQVAARGAHHWRVEKRVQAGTTLSTVIPLGQEARIDELARMVAGDRVTEAARDAARSLLAGQDVPGPAAG